MTSVHDKPDGIWAEVGRFYLWACAASWAVWGAIAFLPDARTILVPLGTFGPLVAVRILTGRIGLPADIERPRLGIRWYLILLGPPAVMLAGIALSSMAGERPDGWADPNRWYLVIPVLGYVALFGGPLGEEPGWRGFALDRLQSTLRPIAASLVLGVAWTVWHWPLFLVEGAVQQEIPVAAFASQIVVTSVFYTWIWNRTHSLVLVIGFHTVFNTSVGLLPIVPTTAGTTLPLWMSLGLATALAAALVIATGGRLGLETRSGTAGEVSTTKPSTDERSPAVISGHQPTVRRVDDGP